MEEAEKGHAMGRNIVGKANRGGASREWVITDQKKKGWGKDETGKDRNEPKPCLYVTRTKMKCIGETIT